MEQDQILAVARAIIASPDFQSAIRCAVWSALDRRFLNPMIREITLQVLVQEEHLRRLGAVRAFLSACEARRVRVVLRDGKLLFANIKALGTDLRAVLTVYRQDIVRHLEMEAKVEARLAAERNGKEK